MRAADSVVITTIVDNYVNGFLAGSEAVYRPRIDVLCWPRAAEPCLAEFGWSALIRIESGGTPTSVLFDASLGRHALIHNAESLRIDLTQLDRIVISHGHPDHTASTREVLSAIGKDDVPLMLHPTALSRRAFAFPNGDRSELPFFLAEGPLKDAGGRLEKSSKPTLIGSDRACVTGEIPRRSEFEKGLPPGLHYTRVDGEYVHDPWIRDDQDLVINLRDKGLVVISGCAHAGIVNTVNYAREISGVDKVHAIVGGFHLTGAHYAPAIEPTVAALRRWAPDRIIPSHCTGLRALVRIANALPDAFLENSVGSTFRF